MNELEFETMCKDAIKNCMWRDDTLGTGRLAICRGECLPCKRCIEVGRCDAIKNLIKKLEKEK